jgi:hypothetical protein
MKKLAFVLLLSLNSVLARGQVEGGGFSPSNGGPAYVPAGTAVVYNTVASVEINVRGNVDDADFSFEGEGTTTPSGFEAYRGLTTCNVQITIESDISECYNCNPCGITAIEVGNSSVGFFYSFGPVVFYDPHITGHAKAYSFQLPYSDTINFGNTMVGDSVRSQFQLALDSLGQYRAFKAINAEPPFRTTDSIPMGYSCSQFSTSSFVWFVPTQPGLYIDTVYFLDPLTQDSIPLVLTGNAYDADVAESTSDESAMQVYPNPCDRFANIVLPSQTLEQVEIRNALGATIQSFHGMNSDFTLDASSLPDGIYFIEGRTLGAIEVKKLVVIH